VSLLEPAARFAIAIVLDALAFVIWNVGTRPPLTLVRDISAGARHPKVLLGGVARFLLGLGLLVLAGLIARPSTPTARSFTFLETWMLIAALLVEMLIGNDLRVRARRASPVDSHAGR
jgi:hypothetical protein